MKKIILLAGVSLLSLGCPHNKKPPEKIVPKSQPSTQPVTATSNPEKKTAKRLGESCTGDPFTQADCDKGLICGPGPGGFCTALKNMSGSCDAGVWVDTARGGEACAPSCKTDDDCRSKEGYTCDVGWGACVLGGFAAPKPPVCSATKLVKKSFGAAKQLSTTKSPGLYTFEPTAALLKDGGVSVAYITKGGMFEGNSLGLSLLSAKGELTMDQTLSVSDREDYFDPWMASDRSGKLYLVWLGFNGHRYPEKDVQIGFSTSADGKTWSKATFAHDPADCPEGQGCFDKPMIAIGPQKKNAKADAIYVAYSSEVAEGLRLTRSTDGATFSKAVTVTDGAYGDLEVDPLGNVHVVVVGSNPAQKVEDPRRINRFGDLANAVVYASSADDGATFTTSIVSAPEQKVPFYFSNPQVVADTKKKLIYVVYPAGESNGVWDIYLATSSDNGKTWSRIKVNDDTSCANHMTPTAVLDPKTNKVHVVWTENRSGDGGIAYSVCDSGGKKCSANEAVNDAPFAAYSLGRFSTKWQGEYYSILLDAKSRKLHVIWTQSVDENGEAHARIFQAEAKL